VNPVTIYKSYITLPVAQGAIFTSTEERKLFLLPMDDQPSFISQEVANILQDFKSIYAMTILNNVAKASRSHGLYLVASLLILLSSCAVKTPFLTSMVIPSARGSVKVDKDKLENYSIDLSVEYLAEAERLSPPKKTYVIWMESDRSTTKNIGQINTTKGSNNLKANFKTSSSYEPTRIFISAEDDGLVSYPGNQVVLTTGKLKGL
jgi:hypothetical protein